jgi:secondary thiamine-phosphate synthase enzyme
MVGASGKNGRELAKFSGTLLWDTLCMIYFPLECIPLIRHQILQITTGKGIAIHNVTAQVQAFVSDSGITYGQVLVCSRHTTTAIAINEDEIRLLTDIQTYLEKLAPAGDRYLHNDLHLRPNIPVDEPMNAHSHLMAITLGNSETIPIHAGQLALGTYQSILLVELDGSRERQVWCQAMGESGSIEISGGDVAE